MSILHYRYRASELTQLYSTVTINREKCLARGDQVTAAMGRKMTKCPAKTKHPMNFSHLVYITYQLFVQTDEM